MEDNQPMVKSANMMAEDQFFKGNILETCNSDSQTLAHKELAKNVVYPNCRSSSVSGQQLHHWQMLFTSFVGFIMYFLWHIHAENWLT